MPLPNKKRRAWQRSGGPLPCDHCSRAASAVAPPVVARTPPPVASPPGAAAPPPTPEGRPNKHNKNNWECELAKPALPRSPKSTQIWLPPASLLNFKDQVVQPPHNAPNQTEFQRAREETCDLKTASAFPAPLTVPHEME